MRFLRGVLLVGGSILGLLPSAWAQSPLSCTTQFSAPPTVRVEGRAELLGDLLVTCTGGTATSSGNVVPSSNFTVSLSGTNITSRLLSSSGTEAFLFVDEPGPRHGLAPDGAPLPPCVSSTNVCTTTATSASADVYNGYPGHPNVFQGFLSSSGTLVFPSVPFEAPGTLPVRVFRIKNIRADASNIPAQASIQASISASGVTIQNGVQILAYTAQSLSSNGVTNFQRGSAQAQFSVSANALIPLGFMARSPSYTGNIYGGNYPASGFVDNDHEPTLIPQDFPQFSYYDETGFYSPAFPSSTYGGNLSRAGLADEGARIQFSFSNLAPGSALSAPAVVNLKNVDGSSIGVARLVQSAAGQFAILGTCCGSVNLPIANGSAVAVYEVLQQNLSPANLIIPFTATPIAGTNFGASINVSYGPTSFVGTADPTAPLPRFVSSALNATIQGTQLISLNLPVSAPVNAGPVFLQANSTAGLPVALSSTTPSVCSVSALIVTPVAPGTCVIQANQAGNSVYAAAPTVVGSFAVVLPSLTVSASGGGAVAVGTPFSASVSAAGGSGNYTYAASGLPPGLSINSGTGAVTGVPGTPGNYLVTLSVNDATYGIGGSVSFTISVAGIVTSSLPKGTVGTSYSANLQAAGMGQSPLWSAAGTLPPGLAVSPSGQLSGTPTTAASYSVNVTASGNGFTLSSSFVVVVLAAPQFVTQALPAGVVKLPYSASISVTGGVPPYKFSLPFGVFPPVGLTMDGGGNITGTPLVQGTSGFSVNVTDSLGATVQQSFAITIAAAGPLLNVSASALSFGTNVTTQGVSVTSAVAGSPVGFSAAIGSGVSAPNTDRAAIAPQGLFTVSGGGTTPAVVAVSLNTSLFATLSAGTYTAALILTPSVQGAPSVQVPLSATQATLPAQLSAQPAVLSFRANATTPGPQSGSISVSNTGGGSFTFTASGGGGFITGVSASQGTVSSSSPGQVTVSIDSTGYTAGEYSGTVNISSSAGSQSIAVTLDVQPATAVLALSQTGVRFLEADNAAASPLQTVGVYNVGASGSTLNFTVALVSGSDWLSLSASGSSATRQSPASLSLSPLSGLARSATPRYALIKVTDTATAGSAQFIQAVLDPGTPAAFPDPTPSGLVFVAAAGSAAPAQGAKLNTNGSAAYNYSTSAATSSGGSWLSVSPASGTTSAAQPGVISAIASAANLTPGIYNGTIQVAISGSVRTIYVTFIVTSATGSSPERELSTSHDATCAPTKLSVTPAGIAGNFNVPAAWPASLIVRMYNDCGSAVTNGRVVVNFSNGDPPISLLSDNLTGTYTGTWNVGAVSPAMTVTATGSLTGVASATATITGAVTTNSTPPPSIAANGIVHNSYPRLGGALAPGNVAAIYGVGLANQMVSPGVVPLPTNFNGTDVVIGGLDAPLYFLSPGQLNVQIPFELAPNKSYQAVAIVNNAVTAPQTIALIPASPGVSAYSDGSVIAQHSDYSLVTAASPAKPGETLIMYLAGMGATTATVASGAPSPAAQVTAPVSVTVDGQSAAVAYAGFTPGGIGLYQINFTIPAGARTGSLPVVVTEGGVAANATTVPVKGN